MNPTDILMNEHRAIERMLTLLERTSENIESAGEVNVELFEFAVRFIKTFADACHHGKEEDLLFTTLIDRGFPKDGGPIAVMLQEHEIGRAYVRSLDEALTKYNEGNINVKNAIAESALGYTNLLRNHIFKEDTILFRMADQHLSANDQKILLEKFADVQMNGEACKKSDELLLLLEQFESKKL